MFNDIKELIVHLWHVLATTPRLGCASIGVGLLIAVIYFKLFFRDVEGFGEDVDRSPSGTWYDLFLPVFYRSPDMQWSDMKFIIWVAMSVGGGVLAYHQLPGWFPSWFPTS